MAFICNKVEALHDTQMGAYIFKEFIQTGTHLLIMMDGYMYYGRHH